jgi:hypothetical protein
MCEREPAGKKWLWGSSGLSRIARSNASIAGPGRIWQYDKNPRAI